MIQRYRRFIQGLNNIPKVCILLDMLMDGLSRLLAPVATAQCYPSQAGRGWFDDEAFVALMGVRAVQCRARYAEAFTIEKSVPHSASDYSVN
jgi:hypothetical protein